MLYEFLKPFAVFLVRMLFGLESRGRAFIPATGPVLLVANHSSVLDPLLVGTATDRQLHFLAKAELFTIPLFGRLIRAVNAHPTRREGADASALRAALRILARGGALLVFPEGTRGEEGEIRAPKAGAGMLALMSGAAVVPAYVSGSGRAWPRGRRLPRRQKVIVTFGPPLRFETSPELGRKERAIAISHQMMAAIARLRDEMSGADSPGRLPLRTLRAAGGAGVTAQSPTQNT